MLVFKSLEPECQAINKTNAPSVCRKCSVKHTDLLKVYFCHILSDEWVQECYWMIQCWVGKALSESNSYLLAQLIWRNEETTPNYFYMDGAISFQWLNKRMPRHMPTIIKNQAFHQIFFVNSCKNISIDLVKKKYSRFI